MAIFSASLRKSFADVTRRTGRSLLVIVGIFIGVFGLTAINTTEVSILSSFAYASGYHATQPDITLNVDQLDPVLLPTLQAIPNVSSIQYQSIYRTRWDTNSVAGQIPLAIQSYPDLAHVPLHPFQLTDGRYPGVGEILLDYSDQSVHGFRIGDMVRVQTNQGSALLRVVGITSTAGFTSTDKALGYMSVAGLQQIAGVIGVADAPGVQVQIPSLVHDLNVKVQHTNELGATVAALTQLLTAHQMKVLYTSQPGVNVNAALIEKTIDGLFWLLRILVILAVLMSSFLILSTVTTLIAEQTTIIGIMKAMGGSQGRIMAGYLVTVTIACMPATLIGVAGGLAAGSALAGALAPHIPLALVPFAADPSVIALSLVVGFGVPFFAALLPIWNGTHLTVHEALSAYGVHAGTDNTRLTRLGQRLTWVSQITWLGVRSTFRKRWRAALTLLTLSVAGSCFLVVQTAVTSINETVVASTSNSSADLSIFFNDPMTYSRIRDQLAALPNIKRIERHASGNVTSTWGTLAAAGYEPHTQIYHYQLTSGRWLRPGDTNVILLSDDAVRKTGLHVGDKLIVNGRTSLTVIGTVHQTITVLGWIGAAIIPIDTMDALQGTPTNAPAGETQQIIIAARDRSLSAVNQLTAEVNAIVNPSGAVSDDPGYYSGHGGTIDTTQEYISRRQGTWYILYDLLYGAVLLVGIAGVLGLANALVASVADRHREIGILRAMGASSWHVAQVFWVEGASLGSLASVIGAAWGVPLAYAFVQVIWQVAMPVDFHIDLVAFAIMLVAILSIASVASMAPTWRATHVRTAEMLRYE